LELFVGQLFRARMGDLTPLSTETLPPDSGVQETGPPKKPL
jgi:hypothetical protein